MDLTSFSAEQRSRREQPRRSPGENESQPSDRSDIAQEARVQRAELEVQNRMLRETQAELEAVVQRYADLYDHLPIGYVTLTPQGRIIGANLTAASWLRRDRATLLGAHMNWFFDAFDAGRFAAHLEACLHSGSDVLMDVTLRLDGGLLMTVELSSRRAPARSPDEALVHTAITNIAKIRQAQEFLSDIHREQEAFSTTLAQDFRTPLVTISTHAQAILKEHGDALPAGAKTMLERMRCAALRSEATLHQLLEFCCLGSHEIALDPLSLDHVVQQVLLEHRAMIERHGVDLAVDRSMPCVRGSRLILTQVLANVLMQAIKATPAGRAPVIRISAVTRESGVVLKIADGLPRTADTADGPDGAEQQFRVFERQTGYSSESAASLTLAIIRRAIERMHGRVWIEPDGASGTCIHLELLRA